MNAPPTGAKHSLYESTDGYGRSNEDDNQQKIPIRNVEKLFCSSRTVDCALRNHCVPCGYKVCCFDVALDTEFTRVVPNQRPELCPRTKENEDTTGGNTLGYRPGMRVLTVGDGDFSFSLAVARLLSSGDSNKDKVNLVASSYESKETLSRVYPTFVQTALELDALGATVCYEVDATRLKETLPATVTTAATIFHRIVWNFPCTAITEGQDGQNDAMEMNKQLVRDFVKNARMLLEEDGEIHMCHKTKPPFNQWKIETVTVELVQEDEPVIKYKSRIVLDRCLLPPYQPRKALHSKSFPCHDACFYVFGVASSCSENSIVDLAQGTIPENPAGYDGTSKNASLVPITRKLILSIRESLLEQAPSKHNKRQPKRRRL
jgi:25S rRNA (uracil2634-N3)-methyltransferase